MATRCSDGATGLRGSLVDDNYLHFDRKSGMWLIAPLAQAGQGAIAADDPAAKQQLEEGAGPISPSATTAFQNGRKGQTADRSRCLRLATYGDHQMKEPESKGEHEEEDAFVALEKAHRASRT
jgi:hypothetical protein